MEIARVARNLAVFRFRFMPVYQGKYDAEGSGQRGGADL
jgi:hypothetical protein